jgi:4-oxalocrotonate tautomerase
VTPFHHQPEAQHPKTFQLSTSRRPINIERTDDLVLIQLTVSNTRIVERLGKNPGLRSQDIFLNLLEVAKENWSFGNGEAQYA